MSRVKSGFMMIALPVALLSLGACGHSTGDRVASGAGIGAAGGAVLGAVGGNPLLGAAAGAAAGGAIGGLTDSNQVDLGKPLWR